MNTTTIQPFPISPKLFWLAFSEMLRDEWTVRNDDILRRYDDATQWTLYLTGLVATLAQQFSCTAELEHWPRIDVAYFDQPGNWWSKRSLEVAIELENDEHWHDELYKLMVVNAGLKVLIAYVDNDQFRMRRLREFIDIYKSRRYNTDNCGWLLIFGPRLLSTIRTKGKDFMAFTFDGTTIADITGNTRIVT